MHLSPVAGRPQAVVVPRPTLAWGAVLLDESPVKGGLMPLLEVTGTP